MSKTTTMLSTSLSGGGKSGTSISVPPSTAVTDASTLTGTNAATATGTVTYDVYSNTTCTTAVSSGSPETITTAGKLPASTAVTLPPGTYYWKASYSGDVKNLPSTSTCGASGEVETVPTTVATSLSTLLFVSGETCSNQSDGGSGNANCSGYGEGGGSGKPSGGWGSGGYAKTSTHGQGRGSGRGFREGGCQGRQGRVQEHGPGRPGFGQRCSQDTGLLGPQLEYGGSGGTGGSGLGERSGCGGTNPGSALLTVVSGTPVFDTASLSGADASSAAGRRVTYDLYGNDVCTGPTAGSGGTVAINAGRVPPSNPGHPRDAPAPITGRRRTRETARTRRH